MKQSRKPRASAEKSCPFLVTDENRFAWQAVQSILSPAASQHRGQLYVLHGPSGTGKSHLCGMLARDTHPEHTLRFESIDLLEKLGPDNRHEAFWPESTSSARVLIVEDLQHLRHESVQRAFAWRIDEMLRRGTTGLFTSIAPPGELPTIMKTRLLPRLQSRLRSGTVISVRLPGPESRLKLLEHFCSHLQIALPHEVLRLFAERLSVSPRELLGTLLSFEELARIQRQLAALPLARAFLRQAVGKPEVSIHKIAKTTARQFGVRLSEMRSAARHQSLTLPRQCAMFLCRELTAEQLSSIGAYFSNRSHSTVLHSCGRAAKLVVENAGLRREVERIRKSLHSQ